MKTDAKDAVELARQLVRCDTVEAGESNVAAIAAARLEAAGYHTRLVPLAPGRDNLVASWPGGERAPLCLTGHLDTVPPGTDAWRFDPHGGEVADGRLHGRGSSDMKSGVAAMVVAAEMLAARGGAPDGLCLLFTAGEETGCEGAATLPPDALGTRVGGLLVGEPTANHLAIGHKGALWLRLVCTGRAAHGSLPDQGENAIEALAEALSMLDRFRIEPTSDPLLGEPTMNVGTIAGGTATNIVPDRADATVDVRVLPGADLAALLDHIRAALGPAVSVEPIRTLPPVRTGVDDPFVEHVANVLRGQAVEPTPIGVTYFTDASVLQPLLGDPPTVICGPGDPQEAHRTDESCSIDRLVQAAEIYAETAALWKTER